MSNLWDCWINASDELKLKLLFQTLQPIATVITGIALFGNFWVGQKNAQIAQDKFENERDLNENRLITERFSKAGEQLGSEQIAVRLCGIHSLRRIAQDSTRDRETIVNILTDFIREKSPLQTPTNNNSQKLSKISTDIQLAIKIICEFSNCIDDDGFKEIDLSYVNFKQVNLIDFEINNLNLSHTNLEKSILEFAVLKDCKLSQANLTKADLFYATLSRTEMLGICLSKAFLEGAELMQANLQKANLENANLCRANLQNACLIDANLRGADLTDAILTNAQLRGADLTGANLLRANLKEAGLADANLIDANLEEADFTDAKLADIDFKQKAKFQNCRNLTIEQVKSAKYWQEAIYDPEFLDQLNCQS